MEKIKQFIQNNTKWIIIFLVLVIFIQACGGCSKKTKYQFKDYEQTEQLVQKDSIITSQKAHIDSLGIEIITLRDSIKMLAGKYEQSQSYIQGLQDDKKVMRDIIKRQNQ